MNARTKRRMQSAFVASALGSSLTLLAMFGLMMAVSGCNEASFAGADRAISVEDRELPTEQKNQNRDTSATISEMSMSGEITALNDDNFTFEHDGEEYSVMVGDNTTYTLDGLETTLDGLKVGHLVNVTLRQDGDKMTAESIVATSRVEES